MTQFKQFLNNLISVLIDTRKAYAKRHVNRMQGS
jgi:hypothetical protein